VPLVRKLSIEAFIKELSSKAEENPEVSTLATSIGFLQSQSEEAYNLLLSILFFPSGVFETDLIFLAKDYGYQWQESITIVTDSASSTN
jgi:hypothetical protein